MSVWIIQVYGGSTYKPLEIMLPVCFIKVLFLNHEKKPKYCSASNEKRKKSWLKLKTNFV